MTETDEKMLEEKKIPKEEELFLGSVDQDDKKVHTTLVPCKKCQGRVFKIKLNQDLLDEVDRYPFTIITMHTALQSEKKEIHTLVVYIDKDLNARHVEVLSGKRVFITPYILYNPSMLFLSCNKNMGKF
ncbi:MAG: hypothetical protein GF353_22240 [Candidatus Lokiarchaeota archaeon]|nr:hypothetical protein [Candidatus Lokiarchaeota archaeon]